MTESLLGAVLGGEDEDKAESTKVGSEAIAAAVAANLAIESPEVAAEAAAFFREQVEVLKVQKKILEAEHEYFETEWRPRLLGIRLRVGFQVFAILAATVIGIGVAVMILDAVTSRRAVIEPFDIAPNVAARVPSGKIVAGGLLDELSRLQDATRTSVQGLDLSSAWASHIKLEVPETGISLDEISRLLRERFGHDVHLDGDLVGTSAGGLALTVRGNGVPPKTFTGSATELDTLTVKATEYVYSKSQPARWAYYLQNAGRSEEAIAFCRTAFGSVSKEDRPYLLNVWANSINNSGGSPREALGLYRAALSSSRTIGTATTTS